MDTEKMLAEFEAWHRDNFKDRLQDGHPTRDMHNGKYAERYTVPIEQARWEAWQASRAAIVVDLPERAEQVYQPSGVNTWDRCRAAIEAAGLTVKE